MESKPKHSGLQVFFYYFCIISVVNVATMDMSEKSYVENVTWFFYRYIWGITSGIFSALGMMIGVDLYNHIKRKINKK